MSDQPDLVARLREVIKGPSALSGLTPEQVARWLEAMRWARPCGDRHPSACAACDACWSSMLSAFLAACKEG